MPKTVGPGTGEARDVECMGERPRSSGGMLEPGGRHARGGGSQPAHYRTQDAQVSELADGPARLAAIYDLDRSLSLEAGAGTGKTSLLVRRVLQIVMSGWARLSEIVAITFTEKAAAELRSRLGEAIADALEALGGDSGAKAEPDLKSAQSTRLNLERALGELEAAQISTIHAFAMALLKECPLEAGLDPGFSLLDEPGAEFLFQSKWQEWLSSEMDRLAAQARGDRTAGSSLERALCIGVRLKDVEDLARTLHSERSVVLDRTPAHPPGRLSVGPDGSLSEFLGSLRSGAARLNRLVEDSCRDPEDRGAAAIRELSKALERVEGAVRGVSGAVAGGVAGDVGVGVARAVAGAVAGDVGELAELLLQLELAPKGAIKGWRSREACAEQKRIFEELREQQEAFKASYLGELAADLSEWLLGFVRELDGEKRRRGALDFDDLLILCRGLLRKNLEIRGYFQRKYKFLLVDEFQDTDPLQVEIAFFLAEDGPRASDWTEVRLAPGKLFLVGDPKQSIYRFRRADIEVYSKANQVLQDSGRQEFIIQNFRTVPSIVNWVNTVFGRMITKSQDGRYQPEYVPLVPFRKELSRSQDPAVSILFPRDEEPAEGESWRKREAAAIAHLIGQAVGGGEWAVCERDGGEERSARYGDVAVLVPTATGIHLYEDALEAEGISHRIEAGRLFYARLEVHHLINVLWAVDDPFDRAAVVAALRSPFLGVSDEELFLYKSAGGSLEPPFQLPGRPLDGEAFEGEAHKGQAHKGEVSEGEVSEGEVSEGEVSEGEVSEGEASEGEVSEGEVSEGEVSEGEVSEEAFKGKAFERDAGDARDEFSGVTTGLSLLWELHLVRNAMPLPSLIMRFFERTKALEVSFVTSGGSQVVTNLMKIVDQARLFERQGASFRRLVTWLRDARDQLADETDPLGGEAGDDRVLVLTIHKAKGLEFPVVILANLNTERTDRPSLVALHGRGSFEFKTGTKERGPATWGWEESLQAERLRSEAETRRLLYVAATRARDNLIVSWFAGARPGEAAVPRTGTYLALLASVFPVEEAMAGGPWWRAVRVSSGAGMEAGNLSSDELVEPGDLPIGKLKDRAEASEGSRASDTDPEKGSLPGGSLSPEEAWLSERRLWGERLEEVKKQACRPLKVINPSQLGALEEDAREDHSGEDGPKGTGDAADAGAGVGTSAAVDAGAGAGTDAGAGGGAGAGAGGGADAGADAYAEVGAGARSGAGAAGDGAGAGVNAGDDAVDDASAGAAPPTGIEAARALSLGIAFHEMAEELVKASRSYAAKTQEEPSSLGSGFDLWAVSAPEDEGQSRQTPGECRDESRTSLADAGGQPGGSGTSDVQPSAGHRRRVPQPALIHTLERSARAAARRHGIQDRARELEQMGARLIRSVLWERLLSASRVHCEVPFIYKCEDHGEPYLVQGRIDLILEETGGLVLVDYKTDSSGARALAFSGADYRRQMSAYRGAVAGVTGLAVKEAWFFFARTGELERALE